MLSLKNCVLFTDAEIQEDDPTLIEAEEDDGGPAAEEAEDGADDIVQEIPEASGEDRSDEEQGENVLTGEENVSGPTCLTEKEFQKEFFKTLELTDKKKVKWYRGIFETPIMNRNTFEMDPELDDLPNPKYFFFKILHR